MNFLEREILNFLEKNLQKKIREEGWGTPSDLQRIKKCKGNLTELLSIQKTLRPVNLEKKIQKTLPIRIYRGLPAGKKGFSHLPSLKKCASDKALFSLYSFFHPKKPKIALLTWVQPDGLGDFYASLETAKILVETLPDAAIELWAISKSPLPKITEFPVRNIAEDFSLSQFEDLQKADLVLAIPTVHPKMNEIRETIDLPRWECIGEYGFSASDWFHPESGNHSLGLHFLEKGIFIRKALKEKCSTKRRFFLAYLNFNQGIFVYLTAILKYLEKDFEDITICFPGPARMYSFYKERQQKGSFLTENYGLAKVTLQLAEHTIAWETGAEGKHLTIFCPERLEANEYQRLLQESEEFGACRGDQSFSEAVSLGKAFFYEPRNHNRYFVQDLVQIAEKRIAKYPSSVAIIKLWEKFLAFIPPDGKEDESALREIGERMGVLLQEPDAIKGLKKFSTILAKDWSCNSFLVHLVQRALFFRQNPAFEEKESQIMKPFYRGYKGFDESLSNLSRELLDGK